MNIQAPFAVRKEIWCLLAGAAVVAAALWPWSALQKLPPKQQAVDQQLMQVQTLAAQAQHLRSQAKPLVADSRAQLQQTAHRHWGDAGQLAITGNRAVLTLHKVPAAQWVAGLAAMQQSLAVRVDSAQLEMVSGGYVSGRVELQWPGQ